jgi:AhpD family alkylhydroperoxidase
MNDISTLVPGVNAALERFPGTVNAYRNLSETLSQSVLSERSRALIGLAVAQHIRCDYCVWVYTRLASHAGLNGEDMLFACAGTSRDAREAAMVQLSLAMMSSGVLRSPADCDPAAARLFTQSEITEIFAQVAYAILSCYVVQSLAPEGRAATRTRRAA